MTDKYIIKNCPCYNNERFLTGFLNDKDTICTYYSKSCQDCTNCVLKRIVELCRGNKEYALEYLGHRDMLAEEILQLLDIQEVIDE